jgi:penicillin amidase
VRLLKLIATAVVIFAAMLIGGGYGALRASLPKLDGERPLPGLRGAVSIERDALGIPTIQATDRLDLARAVGFLHGQERFFQMDLWRRAGAGEFSELFGSRALATDKRIRRHRMRHVAGEALKRAAPDELALLQAYAEGVNAGLQALHTKPFEYWVLRTEPEAWTVEDSQLVVYAMFFDLTDEDGDRDLKVATIRESLPAAVADFLMPAGTEWDAPIVGEKFTAPPIPPAEVYDLRTLKDLDFPPIAPGSRSDFYWRGSNNWAVAGAHTQSGGALVAGDMHLGFSVPHIWYRARFRVDGSQPLDLTGVALPGVPFMVAGSNGHIAWAFTNSYGDWTDIQKVDESAPIEKVTEILHVKGGDDVTYEIARTAWGPIIAAAGVRYAVRWLAHDPEAINLRVASLEQARTVEQAIAVANQSGIPPQNIVVGDADGHIGWSIVGRIPLRGGGDWKGWTAPDQYPRVIDPPSGRIWTANNRVGDAGAVAVMGDGGYDQGPRASQIRDDLLQIDKATPQDMLKVQLDDRALFLARWQQMLLKLLDEPALQGHEHRGQARKFVEQWGERAAIDSVGYRVVKEWRMMVMEAAFGAITAPCRQRNPDFAYGRSFQMEGPLWQLVTQQPAHLLHPRYPDWNAFLLAALDAVIEPYASQPGGLAARRWGERNTLSMQHPLSKAIPVLARFLDMPAEPLPGDGNMPRVQGPTFGASQRMAVTPGREAEGIFHMPGGQSGHPLSPYYRAGHAAWAQGQATPFLPGAAEHKLTLRAP